MDERQKKNIKQKQYNKSDRGREMRAKYMERNRIKLRKYIRDFMRKRREKSVKLGLCCNCLRRKRFASTAFCEVCRNALLRNAKVQRARKILYKGVVKKMNMKKVTKKSKKLDEIWEAIKKRDYSSGTDVEAELARITELIKNEKDKP